MNAPVADLVVASTVADLVMASVRTVPGLPPTVLGVGTAVLLAVGLAVLGVVGSLVPGVPGAGLSLSGVLLYWWSTGYTDPSTPVLAGFVLLALLVLAVDWFAGALSARAGGASGRTAVLAGATGFALLFVVGPLGVLLGVAGTVFAVEYRRHGDAERGVRTALYATIGMLASTVAQVLLTGLLLVGLVAVILL